MFYILEGGAGVPCPSFFALVDPHMLSPVLSEQLDACWCYLGYPCAGLGRQPWYVLVNKAWLGLLLAWGYIGALT